MDIIKYQKGTSYWMKSVRDAEYPNLEEEVDIDVAIIGAGIAGLSSAYLLKQAGLTVAVLEKDTVGSGTTGHTTGKVTSQHNLIYAALQKRFGTTMARLYGEANQEALKRIKEIIATEGIECDWRDEDNYVFTENTEQIAVLKNEAEVARPLGLPANFQTETPLPFPVKGAVRFTDQGTFHSRKYLQGLASAVTGDGSHVFEHTEAKSIHDGNSPVVETEGGSVHAKHVIIATLVPYPLTTHAVYGLVEYPLKSYIVATRTDVELQGMYITPDNPTFSILPVVSGGEKLLLVGGQSHIPGLGSAETHYQKLINYAQERFDATPTEYQWSAWDYLSYDSVPVIGKLYPWSKNVYVATGFMKWGLTNGTVAGMILRDLIIGTANPWTATFDSMRTSTIKSIPRFITKLPKLVG